MVSKGSARLLLASTKIKLHPKSPALQNSCVLYSCSSELSADGDSGCYFYRGILLMIVVNSHCVMCKIDRFVDTVKHIYVVR